MSGLQLPHDLDAERAVLAALLVREEAIDEALTHVAPECFYDPNHGAVLAAAMELDREGATVDAVGLIQRLRANEVTGAPGELLHELLAFPYVANVERQAERVAALYRQRRLIAALQSLVAKGYQAPPNEWTDDVERTVYELSERPEQEAERTIDEQIEIALSAISEREKPSGIKGFWPTPWQGVNRLIHGIVPSRLYIVAATPGIGKTSFCLQLAWSLAGQKFGDDVLVVVFFSMEMPDVDIVDRALSQVARVPNELIRLGQTRNSWQELTAAANMLRAIPLFIDDKPALSVLEIRSRTRRAMTKLRRKHPGKNLRLAAVVCDHLQKMTGQRERSSTRSEELGGITGGLCKMAKDFKCAVVALSQLNRTQQKEKNREPILADLRESGAIEADADTVMFLYDSEAQRAQERQPETDIIVAKNRGAATGRAKLHFDGKFTLFSDYEPDREGGFHSEYDPMDL